MTSFSETRAVIWVSGQLFETGMKLWPVSSEFVKIRICIRKIEKVKKKCCNQKNVFCQKKYRKWSGFKKVNLKQKMFAKIQFLSRFQEFWNCKIGFFASKKIPNGFVCFFDCKLPTQNPPRKSARAVYVWWNWAKLLTMKNYVHFFCETGAFIWSQNFEPGAFFRNWSNN